MGGRRIGKRRGKMEGGKKEGGKDEKTERGREGGERGSNVIEQVERGTSITKISPLRGRNEHVSDVNDGQVR